MGKMRPKHATMGWAAARPGCQCTMAATTPLLNFFDFERRARLWSVINSQMRESAIVEAAAAGIST